MKPLLSPIIEYEDAKGEKNRNFRAVPAKRRRGRRPLYYNEQ